MNNVHSQPHSLLSQDEQEVSVSCPPNSHRQWYVVFFVAAILLIAGGTVVWVLNIIGLVSGPWSSVFGAIFTGTGIIVALLDSLLALVHVDGRRE